MSSQSNNSSKKPTKKISKRVPKTKESLKNELKNNKKIIITTRNSGNNATTGVVNRITRNVASGNIGINGSNNGTVGSNNGTVGSSDVKRDRPPEKLYDRSLDYYSLGCLMSNFVKPQFSAECSRFMNSLLEIVPHERMSPASALKHCWLIGKKEADELLFKEFVNDTSLIKTSTSNNVTTNNTISAPIKQPPDLYFVEGDFIFN